jgi:hypothetical protein
MRSFANEGERPPRLEVAAAAVAVGYSAGYAAGAGNETQQLVGCAVVAALAWLWEKWSQR